MKTESPTSNPEIDADTLKLPPKRKIAISKGIQSATNKIHEKNMGELLAGKWPGGTRTDEPNNAFLWLLATIPFFFIAASYLFIGYPFEESNVILFVFGDVHSDLSKLRIALSVWIIAMNTLFACLDEYEVIRRGKNIGGGFAVIAAYFLVPVYLLFRGRPDLNHGKASYAAYLVWWIGWFATAILADTGWNVICISMLIALLLFVIAECAYGEQNSKSKSSDIDNALGI